MGAQRPQLLRDTGSVPSTDVRRVAVHTMLLTTLLRPPSPVGLAACGLWLALALAPVAWAQGPIYRCGNEYTNQPGDAQARGCRLVEGGNLTIVQGARPAAAATPPAAGPAAAPAAANGASPARAVPVDPAVQRDRDRDARQILEAELRKAEERLQALQAESRGPAAARGPDLAGRMERAGADVAAIRRELERAAAPR